MGDWRLGMHVGKTPRVEPGLAVDNAVGDTSGEPTHEVHRTVKSVATACQILNILADSPEARITDIAERVGLTKGTVHSLLWTLNRYNLVSQDPSTKRYRLGWGVWDMAKSFDESMEVGRASRLYLQQLAEETGESALLGVLDRDRILFVARAEGDGATRLTVRVGTTEPLHATASGKVLAAWQDEWFLDEFFSDRLPSHTEFTLTDPQDFRRALSRVREDDFATCLEEHQVGVNGVAVPIRADGGQVVAALAIAGPVVRMQEERVPSLVGQLKRVAIKIQTRIGSSNT